MKTTVTVAVATAQMNTVLRLSQCILEVVVQDVCVHIDYRIVGKFRRRKLSQIDQWLVIICENNDNQKQPYTLQKQKDYLDLS